MDGRLDVLVGKVRGWPSPVDVSSIGCLDNRALGCDDAWAVGLRGGMRGTLSGLSHSQAQLARRKGGGEEDRDKTSRRSVSAYL